MREQRLKRFILQNTFSICVYFRFPFHGNVSYYIRIYQILFGLILSSYIFFFVYALCPYERRLLVHIIIFYPFLSCSPVHYYLIFFTLSLILYSIFFLTTNLDSGKAMRLPHKAILVNKFKESLCIRLDKVQYPGLVLNWLCLLKFTFY